MAGLHRKLGLLRGGSTERNRIGENKGNCKGQTTGLVARNCKCLSDIFQMPAAQQPECRLDKVFTVSKCSRSLGAKDCLGFQLPLAHQDEVETM